jgi:hypothetical protein
MTAVTNEKYTDFHWTPARFTLSFLLGLAATMGVWFFAGLLIMLFVV